MGRSPEAHDFTKPQVTAPRGRAIRSQTFYTLRNGYGYKKVFHFTRAKRTGEAIPNAKTFPIPI